GFTSASTTASPMSSRSSATTASRRSSVGGASSTGASSVVGASSANDDRLLALLALPAGGHVLVLDPLLQQRDALDQRLRPGRAPGDVHVHGDDLVHALGDRVAVPVRAAGVGAAAHR